VLRDRFETLAHGGAGRMATWTHLSGVALEQPLTGYGLGSFPMVNAHFLTTPRFAQSDWAINSAHNLLLQWVLQAGLPYALLLIAAGAHGVRQVANRSGISVKRDDWAIIAILFLFALNAMVDITLDMPAPVGFALFLAGLLWGRALDRREVRISRPRAKKRKHKRLIGV
jgi:O-antigen ligase